MPLDGLPLTDCIRFQFDKLRRPGGWGSATSACAARQRHRLPCTPMASASSVRNSDNSPGAPPATTRRALPVARPASRLADREVYPSSASIPSALRLSLSWSPSRDFERRSATNATVRPSAPRAPRMGQHHYVWCRPEVAPCLSLLPAAPMGVIARVCVPVSTASLTVCLSARRPQSPNTFVTMCAIRRRLSVGLKAAYPSESDLAREI